MGELIVSTVPLNENGSVTLDGSGNGKLKMVPHGGGETWLPAVVSFKASSATKEAQCRIYIGPSATDQYFVDGSLSGSTGDSTGRVGGYQVDTHGNALWAVWSGGDVGATATLQVNGTEVIPGSSPFDLTGSLPGPGQGCASPIIGGGGALVYPSIHSPNYVTKVSGWTINKDGSAEFSGLVLRGTFSGTDYIINTDGAFFYSGVPAAGNLVASVIPTVTATDPEGNAAVGPGVASYGVIGGVYFACVLEGAGLNWLTAASQAGPYSNTSVSFSLSDNTGTGSTLTGYLEITGTPVTIGGPAFSNNQLEVTGSIGATLSVFLANRTGDPSTPTGGGRLYVKAGALFYEGSSGTVTPLAPA